MSEPTPTTPPPWWPTPDDVARLVARFAIGTDGKSGGTFTQTTTPNREQVQAAIEGVAQEVANAAGTDLQSAWDSSPVGVSATAARRVVAYGTASQIVLSYYPSGNAQDYAVRLEERYVAALGRLLGGGGSAPDPGTGTGGDDRPATPVGAFPPAPDPEGDRW